MARPRKEIDREDFEKLCGLQCTESEICTWFDITTKTLQNWCKREYHEGFSQVYEKKREFGKISLRRSQFRIAEKNAAMAIFLGKNYLGQSDEPMVNNATMSELLTSLQALEREQYNG